MLATVPGPEATHTNEHAVRADTHEERRLTQRTVVSSWRIDGHVAGRGWGRVLARWRCRKQMKIAVLGGSMTCGGNLAKLHTGPKTNDSTSM